MFISVVFVVLAVKVDTVCGCVDTCDIICCEKPMRPKKRA